MKQRKVSRESERASDRKGGGGEEGEGREAGTLADGQTLIRVPFYPNATLRGGDTGRRTDGQTGKKLEGECAGGSPDKIDIDIDIDS